MAKFGEDPNVQTTSFVKLYEILQNEFGLKNVNLKWNSGNNSMKALRDVDPTVYYGGFDCKVRTRGSVETPSVELPVPPNFLKVTRTSASNKEFDLHTATTIRYVPFSTRARAVKYKYEGEGDKRKKAKNAAGYPVILSTAKVDALYVKGSGYSPNAEIFGFLVDDKNALSVPFVFVIDSWSAWRSYYDKKTQSRLASIPRNDGFLPTYEIGTRGKVVDGKIVPNLVSYNDGWTTPIESFSDNVAHVAITQQMKDILEASQKWVNCSAWNATAVIPEEKIETVKDKFMLAAHSAGLTNDEIAAIEYQANGDYLAALDILQPDEIS